LVKFTHQQNAPLLPCRGFSNIKKLLETMNTSRRKFMQQAIKASALTVIGAPLMTGRMEAKSIQKDQPAATALQFSQVALP
jgi:hypothetical protein